MDPKTGKVTKQGRGFTDSEVTGWLIVLLFAGQHTSSITATWLGAMLLAHPEARQVVQAEQAQRCPDEASLTYANLLEMDEMRRAITETLRLYPPLILLMRKVMVAEGLKVGAHTIPKGDVVGLCAPASNLDPRYWSDVTHFKPERYLPGADAADMFDSRSVGHGLMQGFMLSFGGGAHMCSGRRFGYLQARCLPPHHLLLARLRPHPHPFVHRRLLLLGPPPSPPAPPARRSRPSGRSCCAASTWR